MKKFLIEDISVGVSKDGIACGPINSLIITYVPQIRSKRLIDKNNNLYEDVAEIP